MDQYESYSTEWWLWQLYRQVAEYVNHPDVVREARLRMSIEQYRQHRHQQALGLAPSHERVTDFG